MRRFLLAVWLMFVSLSATAQVSLVPAGAAWKYLDTGVNLGTTWRAPTFNDTAWPSGAAKLGYGQGDEITTVGYGGNASSKFVTTYFRKTFTVADPSALASLTLSVRRDDGIVVYLNGTEVMRDNMPTGTISSSTFAATIAADNGATWISTTVPASALIAGTNVLAVEVHQGSVSSSDIVFNLELTGASGTTASALTRGPYLQLGTATGMTVRWRTATASDSVVRYGLAPTSLTSSASLGALTTEHIVNLSGLTPNTPYYYAIGSSTATLAGGDENHRFLTAPTTQRATRIWVIGDAGTGTADQRSVRDAYASFTGTTHTDLWLLLGDNAYFDGTDAEYQANFFSVYGDIARRSATWPTLGNDDTSGSTSPPASLPYFQNFSIPTAAQAGGVASGSPNYYSYNFGNIHFISLDSMASSRAVGGAMLNWLQNDLAANTKDWVVAYFHHPVYTRGPNRNSDTDLESGEMRRNVMPILESFGVDLVLNGHGHAYERSFLLDGHYGVASTLTSAMKKDAGTGRVTETGAYRKPLGMTSHQGTVYTVAGTAGGIVTGGALDHPAMVVSMTQLGSLVLDVNNTRMDVRFLTDTGVIADNFTIIKGSTANVAPTVALTSPATGASFGAPASITLAATASDSDGAVQRVEFYQGSTLLGTATAAPYTYTWSNVAAGSYTLSARAYDNLGLSTPSSAVTVNVSPAVTAQPTTVITKLSTWKYLADGTDQGSAWRFVGYNDTAWPSGAGQLGYGDGDEGTVIPFGPNDASKYVTSYFRRTFSITDATQIASLTLNLLRDDGAVVYLNGTEVVRSNMPAGTISSATLASTSVIDADESAYTAYNIGTAALAGGVNVIAVEVHQATVDSSDLSFDLELIATPKPTQANQAPVVALTAPLASATYTAPANVTLQASASDTDGSIARVEFYEGTTLLGTSTLAPYTLNRSNVTAGTYSLTARAYDNSGASTISNAVSITVTAPANVAPSVALTAPLAGATYTAPASVALQASASDTDGTIARVEFYQGATLLGTSTVAPYALNWNNVAAGTYSLTARAYDNSGASTVSSAAGITVAAPANVAPSVALTAPLAGATYTAPASVALQASASDTDGTVARVEFYQGTTLLGTSTVAPYALNWSNVAAGTYSLTAKAYDNSGASTVSAARSITVSTAAAQAVTLITKNSVWKYLDNGSNAGTTWRQTAFSDSTWKSGAGQLGYGDGDEATVVSYGTRSSAKYITTYMRRAFNVTDPAAFTSLRINLLRDDGAVVYLNGTEIVRSNMPTGTISSTTRASVGVDAPEESIYYAFTVPRTALVAGNNVIAVEVHQYDPTSSDLSFDLELVGQP